MSRGGPAGYDQGVAMVCAGRKPLILLCLGLALGLSALAADEATTPHSREEIQQGRRIFNQGCTVCHGVDGVAGDRGPAMGPAPGQRRPSLRRTDEQILDAIQNGIPGTEMPPMGLPKGDARRVVSFIRSLRAMAATVPVEGNRDKGADIFWGKGDCGRCHMIRGRGGILGPDLTNLGGSRKLKDIRASLTTAKPKISQGYRPVRVVTKDGRTVSGVSKNEHNFSMQVLGEDERIHLFSLDEVEEVVYAEESLMPNDFDRRLSKIEFQNLVAFLSRLTRAD